MNPAPPVQRRNIMLGTAGHVDHGKTALVKLLTGCETDTLSEEKERGLTIDLGFAPCRLADQRIVGVVDVPGHVDFIRNMVAGAHGIDVVILVVAADDGIMPQTREHLHILTLMGLRHGLVALTKIDLVEAARREWVTAELRRMLAPTFLAGAPICPISNVTGEGYESFFALLNQVVDACEDRPRSGVFRMWVEDVFTSRGSGTVITGIPRNGMVRANDSLLLLPSGRSGHVRRMQVYGAESTEGAAGECVALNVPELDHGEVRRGMLLCASNAVAGVSMAEAGLRILDSVEGKVEDYLEAHVHVGTASVLTRVAMLQETAMTAGESQMVQLRFEQPLPVVPGDRFVLRANVSSLGQSGLLTIGGGRILGVSNARLRRRKQWTLDLFSARSRALDSASDWCALMVRESSSPVSMDDLERKCLLRSEELAPIITTLCQDGKLLRSRSGGLVHATLVENTGKAVVEALKEIHKTDPKRAGLSQEELCQRVKTDGQVCELALSTLIERREVQRNGAVFSVAGWKPLVTGGDQALLDQVAARFQAAGWAPPTPTELGLALRMSPDKTEKAIRLLTEKGILVALDQRTAIHCDAVQSARQVVLRLFSIKPSFTTMEFRDALAVSRKHAIPILDYMD